jgi:ribosomal protein L14
MYVQIKDNSGIKIAKYLKIQSSKQKFLTPGKIAIVFPTKYKYVKMVERRKYHGVIVMTRRRVKRHFYSIVGPYNGVVLYNTKTNLLGSKIFGPTFRELKNHLSPRSYLHRRLFAKIAGRLV